MRKVLKMIDKKLLIATIALFVLGLIMVFSSSNITAFMRYQYDNPASFFVRQLFFLILGGIGFLIFLKFSTKSYPLIGWLSTIIVGVILLLLLIYGTAINDSISWIGYKGFGIQPSEFAKVFLIILFGTYYEVKKNKSEDFLTMIIPVLIGGVITLLVLLQNDFGTAFMIAAMTLFMFLISPTKKKLKKKILLYGALVILAISLILVFSGKSLGLNEKLERFNFLNPCDRYLTTGNQVCNGYIAINNSNGIGRGLGNSTQKYLYLAESHTDFIYAVLIEELGLEGMLVLFALYIFVLARIIIIAKNTIKDSHAMIAYSVAFYIFIHIIINLGGVLGLIPLTGVTLPFISYGGSFTWSLILALTLVQRVKVETTMLDRRIEKNIIKK
ncbi:MAG TPA: FtsW/RodA/SpoVE family cell cycle protein [Bacilli bacterium]|nr:FtsW/RodA/SpoVE family cell cycle protein [Bacilli bacterium]